MIALETSTKIGKSPKKTQVELREDDSDEESDGDEGSCGSETQELESADEGLAVSEDEKESILEDEEEDDRHNASSPKGNPGWADVMQKILRTKKPKRKKTLVLSKAKKLCDVVKEEKKEEVPFEIDGIKEEVKTEAPEDDDKKPENLTVQLRHRRKNTSLGIRVKPSIADRERERMLQKIATKGVVQLFNAVRQQQTEIGKKLAEAGPLERKREQVLKSIDKRSFLDVLMGDSKSIPVDNAVKDEKQESSNVKQKEDKGWNVLRDDFVMGAKLKDWDKQSTGSEDSSMPEDMDSDN